MASLNDIFKAINQNNATLNTIANDIQAETIATQAVKTSVDNVVTAANAVKGSVDQVGLGIDTLVKLTIFTDQALSQISKQTDTVICLLEHISQNTCALLNEAHSQTALQKSIAESSSTMLELFKYANTGAALEWERLEKLRLQIEKCCPPETPPDPCRYQPCAAPKALGPPPDIGRHQPEPPR